MRCCRTKRQSFLKSDNSDFDDRPTGEVPVVSPADSRVTITGAEIAAEASDVVAPLDPADLLPHWTEAPTGQVPVVLARDIDESDPWASVQGPAWREDEADWVAADEQFDTSVLASDDLAPAPLAVSLEDEIPFEDEVSMLDEAPRPEPIVERATRTRRPPAGNPLAGRAVRRSGGKNIVAATVTGVIALIVALGIFKLGPVAVAVLITTALGFAIAEVYSVYRTAGAHPAAPLGILATIAVGVGVYSNGLAALPVLTVLLVVLLFVWYATAEAHVDILDGLSATLFPFVWIGFFGAYAAAMASPNFLPGRDGLAYLLGAIILTVANDTAALFAGRAFGERKLAPAVSPGKTVEGLIGAIVVTVATGLVVLPFLHPWTLRTGLEEAVVVCIVAPLGDLFESMIKRTLGIKDMGALLPGHGGVTDRVDGLLFVLPATYYLVTLTHLV